MMDLEGRLLNKDIKFDCDELAKILKAMIVIEEVDKYLLKIKNQGKQLLS
jgi:methyl coenzyme M reductase beta subunit